ncbi:hypothetical protein P7C70_g9581, partial [Phenoliferia sp. Uapishka_3]
LLDCADLMCVVSTLLPLLRHDRHKVAHLESHIIEVTDARVGEDGGIKYECRCEDGGYRWISYLFVDPDITKYWQDNLTRPQLLQYFPIMLRGRGDTLDKLPVQILASDAATSPWKISETPASIHANIRDRLVVQFLRASRLQLTTALQAMGQAPRMEYPSFADTSRSSTPTPRTSTNPASTSASTSTEQRLVLVNTPPPTTTPADVLGPLLARGRSTLTTTSQSRSSTSRSNSPSPSTRSSAAISAPARLKDQSLKRRHSPLRREMCAPPYFSFAFQRFANLSASTFDERAEDVAPRGGACVTRAASPVTISSSVKSGVKTEESYLRSIVDW